jgi:hypothetical protein
MVAATVLKLSSVETTVSCTAVAAVVVIETGYSDARRMRVITEL